MQKCFEKCKVLCRYKVSLCGDFELMVRVYFLLFLALLAHHLSQTLLNMTSI